LLENLINKTEDSFESIKHIDENSDIEEKNHFAMVGKTIQMPKNAKKIIEEFKLTRYACYLITQNGL